MTTHTQHLENTWQYRHVLRLNVQSFCIVLSVFGECFLNAAQVLSTWWKCFLTHVPSMHVRRPRDTYSCCWPNWNKLVTRKEAYHCTCKGSEKDCKLTNKNINNAWFKIIEESALHMYYEEGNAFSIKDTHSEIRWKTLNLKCNFCFCKKQLHRELLTRLKYN